MDYAELLAAEFSIRPAQVRAAVELLDAGNTIPFIARYRKEATGSLDDQGLREMSERLEYLRNLDKRRDEIRKSLTELDVMNGELESQLAAAKTLSELEDLYRPYRPKRRTRATVAKERELEPLALWLMMQPEGDPAAEAVKYINPEKEVPDAEAALAGARDILAETASDSASLRKELRGMLEREGIICTKAAKDEDSVYSMYYDFREPVRSMAPHRILAVNRGEHEEFLKVALECADRPDQLSLPRRADHLVGDVEKDIKPDAAAVPNPNAAVAALVAEMLQHIVGSLASLPPRAKQLFALAHAPARSKSNTLTSIYTVYV